MSDYYMKPGEEEEASEQERNAKRISKALIGKKKVPAEAALAKQKAKALEAYYKTCAFPKPQDKKPKKKQNGYKDKPNRFCYYCGTAGAERHEVYPGTGRRQICIDEGFQVDLCRECHQMMHENSTAEAKARNLYWRRKYQSEYETKLLEGGVTPEKARELWISLIGRSYL